MRVRVIRWTDPTSSVVSLRVLRWCAGQWENVEGGEFELSQSEQANEFAMKLSLTKRFPVEMAVFEDGEKLEPLRGVDVYNRQHGTKLPDIGESVPENQS